MKKLRDFKCEYCDHIHECLVEDDVKKVRCTKCDAMAVLQLSAPAGSGNAAHGFMRKAK